LAPLYLAECIATIGFFIQFRCGANGPAVCSAAAFRFLANAQREIGPVATSFPEYVACRGKTARLVPGIY